MKILLTVEEYRERAINLVMEYAKKIITETADDYFKYEIISMLSDKCLTNEIMCVDVVNQLYFKTFLTDRNGNPLTKDVIKKIDEKEVEEFNSQEWYLKYNEKARKSYKFCYYLRLPEDMGNDWFDRRYSIEEIVTMPFVKDNNESYKITCEAFKRLYGYDFHIDDNWQFLNWNEC